MKTQSLILIDDDEDDLFLFQSVISDLNAPVQVYAFRNANEAMQFLQSTPEMPGLIVSDINMPMMTGIEFCDAIESDHVLSGLAIPIILLSTSVENQHSELLQRVNVKACLQKGDSFAELSHIVVQALEYMKR